MDKRSDELADALRELAGQRDQQIHAAGFALSSERLKRLRAAAASAFPVDAALRRAAKIRDGSLRAQPPALPLRIESALVSRLAAPRARWSLRDVSLSPESFGNWRKVAAAAALLMAAAGALHFAQARKVTRASRALSGEIASLPVTQSIFEFPAQETPRRAGLVPSSTAEDAQLSLRIGAIDLVALRPSLLTLNQSFLAERNSADEGLPLDLPVQMLINSTAATP